MKSKAGWRSIDIPNNGFIWFAKKAGSILLYLLSFGFLIPPLSSGEYDPLRYSPGGPMAITAFVAASLMGREPGIHG